MSGEESSAPGAGGEGVSRSQRRKAVKVLNELTKQYAASRRLLKSAILSSIFVIFPFAHGAVES